MSDHFSSSPTIFDKVKILYPSLPHWGNPLFIPYFKNPHKHQYEQIFAPKEGSPEYYSLQLLKILQEDTPDRNEKLKDFLESIPPEAHTNFYETKMCVILDKEVSYRNRRFQLRQTSKVNVWGFAQMMNVDLKGQKAIQKLLMKERAKMLHCSLSEERMNDEGLFLINFPPKGEMEETLFHRRKDKRRRKDPFYDNRPIDEIPPKEIGQISKTDSFSKVLTCYQNRTRCLQNSVITPQRLFKRTFPIYNALGIQGRIQNLTHKIFSRNHNSNNYPKY